MSRPRTGLSAAAGLLVVVIGVLVLRAPGAQPEAGWFSYGGPPSPELRDSLLVWNLARGVGALLVLLGLLVLAHLAGVLLGRRDRRAARWGGPELVVGGALVLGGLATFVVLAVLGLHDEGRAVVSISKAVPPLTHFGPPGTVWSRGQAVAALAAAAGLVLGAVGTGLRRGRTV